MQGIIIIAIGKFKINSELASKYERIFDKGANFC